MVARHYRLDIQYDGTDFFGWQIQNEFRSVQGDVEAALDRLYDSKGSRVEGSGRTDAGVHAFGLTASFSEPRPSAFTAWTLRKGLNAVLPADVRVRSVTEAPPDFHGRFSCLGKTYMYMIDTSASSSPILRRHAWHIRHPLDEKRLAAALAVLQGTHDFSAFTVHRAQLKGDAVRSIWRTGVERIGHLLVIHVTGDGFLYRQVRSMTGEVLDCAQGRKPVHHVAETLAAGFRSKAGQTAPAHGLFLARCYYSEAELQEARQADMRALALECLLGFGEQAAQD